MKTFLFCSFILIFLSTTLIYGSPGGKIQVALLLDTSNSMDGLIEQAKTQLWKVVNEFALARHNGEAPQLEIALYEYGNDGLKKDAGFIRMVTLLTTDLDLISEELFKLTTNGGSEYCGQVIQSAGQELKWSEEPGALKIIFIAGNEPFSQGSVDYKKACGEAIARGIIINTIYCGDFEEGIRTSWKDGADLADGNYMNINQDQTAVHIDAPQDVEIMQLNSALNDTYIPYGSQGASFKERQLEQDANAKFYGAAVTSERAVSKASGYYTNSNWDLVDAVERGAVDLEKIETGELPEEMRKMSPGEREVFVREQSKKRQEIRDKIQELDKERRKYVAARQKELSQAGTLEDAIIQCVREQAAEKNFRFEMVK